MRPRIQTGGQTYRRGFGTCRSCLAGFGRSGRQDPAQFNVAKQPFVLISTFIVRISGTIRAAVADVCLDARDIIGAPASLALQDGKGIFARAVLLT